MKSIIAAVLGAATIAFAAIGAIGTASAADMAVKARPMPVVDPSINWSGWYAGLNAGGIFQNDQFSSVGIPGACTAGVLGCTATPNYSTLMAIGGTLSTSNRSNNTGFIGGAQIGYNWQTGQALFGVEADIQGISNNNRTVTVLTVTPSPAFPAFPLTTTASSTEKLTYLGTLRGRIGWVASPAFLLYATGGLAYGEVKQSGIITQAIAPPDPSVPGVGVGTNTTTRAGYAAGAGGEWMFAPNWSVKAEGMYYDLGRVSYALTPAAVTAIGAPAVVTGSAAARFSNRVDGVIARVGVNYHFGGPVVARY